MGKVIQKEYLVSVLQKFTDIIKNSGKVTALYLFGSYAKGRPTPLSDIDLAVLFDKSVANEDYLEERLRLQGEASIILGTDAVELVILNGAPPGLAYRVIKDGELLYSGNEAQKKQLVGFKVKTWNSYFDFLPAQRMFSEGLARRIREGGFGGR